MGLGLIAWGGWTWRLLFDEVIAWQARRRIPFKVTVAFFAAAGLIPVALQLGFGAQQATDVRAQSVHLHWPGPPHVEGTTLIW